MASINWTWWHNWTNLARSDAVFILRLLFLEFCPDFFYVRRSSLIDPYKDTARPCGGVVKHHLLFCSWEIPALRNALSIPAALPHVVAWTLPHSATCTFPRQRWQDSQRCLRGERERERIYLISKSKLGINSAIKYECIGICKCTGTNKTACIQQRKNYWTCGGPERFTLSDVHKMTLSLAAHPLWEQVSVINVFTQHSGHWKTQHEHTSVSSGT